MSRPQSRLARHVPELAIDWLRDAPEERWRVLEGSLCFADISGFTALAERLAQRGRVGGEELVETLGRVFTTMIGIARGRGGVLLKFGGDALLLFFQGPDHAVRAASAAVEMRAALREAAKIPTSVGPLKLSMSVGVHSGDVHFFLVGTTHRELVLLGPGANGVIEAENAARAGEIVVSEATAARLPAGSTTSRADGERLLRWRRARAPVQPTKDRDEDDQALAERLFPGQLGRFLAPGAPDPEHRVACIAFVRFAGTDALLAERGPDALAGILEATLGPAQEVLEQAGVSLLAVDVDRDGGKLFLAAGVPYSHEDDEGVMLRALRKIADMSLPLSLQFGVNRGHVFAAEVGDTRRAAFSAMGDTTNTAARIAAKAPAGSIFAHPATLDECLTLFEVTPAPPLTLKGKAAPLVVYEVGAELGTREREGLVLEQVVGRASELARLRDAAAALASGQGGVLTLEGDTGLGKTRLLREATSALGPSALVVRGEPYGASSAYRALRDPVRRLLGMEHGGSRQLRSQLKRAVGAAAPDLLPMLALIGDVVDVPIEPSAAVRAIEPRFRPDRTAEVMIQLLSAAAGESLAIVVDEAHWCDDATAGLLKRLERETEARPWLLLVARRDVSQGFRPEGGDRLSLRPMPDEEIREIVALLTEAAPLRPHEMDDVVQRTGGYPLVAEEIIRTLRDVGSLDAVPESLEAAMATQVDALDRDARRVLQYASVLGRSFSAAALTDLMERDGRTVDPEHLERLSEFLSGEQDQSRFRFRNGMLRDTVYEGMAYRLRSKLHHQAAESLLARAEDPAQVADGLTIHFARAHDHARAWEFGRLAGDRASGRFAMSDAARLYEIALESARRLGDVDPEARYRVWSALGWSRLSAGELERAVDAYRHALRAARHSPMMRAEALLGIARAREKTGKAASALRELTLARQSLVRRRSAAARTLAAEIESFRANVLFHANRLEAAQAQADRAVEICRQAGATAPLARSLALRDMARTMLLGPGDVSGLRQALSLFEEAGDLVAQGTTLTNLGAITWIRGEWQDATNYLRAARERFLKGGNAPEAALAAYNLAEVLVCQGRADQAGALLADALPVVRAARWTEGVCDIERQLGHVLIEQGRFEEADQLLERTAEAYAALGQPDSELDAILVRAAGSISSGDVSGGWELIDLIEARCKGDPGMLAPRIALLRAIALARQARFREAAEECANGRAAAQSYELPYENALLSRLWLSLPGAGPETATERDALVSSAKVLEDLGVEQTPRSYTWMPTDRLSA